MPGAAPTGPAAPPPGPAPADLVRPIEPVTATWAGLVRAWEDRRVALREQDPVRADAAERAVLAAQRELRIENLPDLAMAEVRASARSLGANLPGDALRHAEVAVALAPDFPDAHLALARARLSRDPGKPGEVVSAAWAGLLATTRDPATRRAFVGDVAGAGVAALLTASAATLALLLLRRLRLFLHDFHHLPLLRGSARIQATFLGLVLLALPLALGLGPLAVLGTALAAVWLYLRLAERVVATVALALVALAPYGAEQAARAVAWAGTPAEAVWRLQHGAVTEEEARALAAAAEAGRAPGALHAALGLHAKRRGELDEALRLYALAEAAEKTPELLVNRGNVLFLRGDTDGAKAAWLAATDRAGADLVVLGAAHYNLSKLYLRGSDVEKSTAARDRAVSEAGEFLRLHGSDDDFSANRYLVDVPVPAARIAALARADVIGEAAREWARARLWGALPRALFPWGAAGFLAALWGLALLGGRIAPSRPCMRCGGASCTRCAAGAGAECGQCVNAFGRKGVVDARDRLRKEAEVRRNAQLEQVGARVLAVAAGGAGHVFHGAPARGFALLAAVLFTAFVIWFWRGLVPPPQPSSWVFWGKLAVAAPLGLGLWALAVRDVFRRTA
jgi:tetratricopeptide (TPR) repeat protein